MSGINTVHLSLVDLDTEMEDEISRQAHMLTDRRLSLAPADHDAEVIINENFLSE